MKIKRKTIKHFFFFKFEKYTNGTQAVNIKHKFLLCQAKSKNKTKENQSAQHSHRIQQTRKKNKKHSILTKNKYNDQHNN